MTTEEQAEIAELKLTLSGKTFFDDRDALRAEIAALERRCTEQDYELEAVHRANSELDEALKTTQAEIAALKAEIVEVVEEAANDHKACNRNFARARIDAAIEELDWALNSLRHYGIVLGYGHPVLERLAELRKQRERL